jgi:ribose transport system permease protein
MVVGDFDLSVAATSALAVRWRLPHDRGADRTRDLRRAHRRPADRVGQRLLIAYVNLSAFVATLGDADIGDGARLHRHRGHHAVQPAPEFNNLGQGKFLEIPLPSTFAIGIS